MLKTSAPVPIVPMLAAFAAYSASIVVAATLALPTRGHAKGSAPNLSGTYRCTPEPVQCQAPTFSVSQNGPTLELKAENGPVAEGKVTSDITLSAGPPWNSNGIVMPDHSIQWSNGTHWRKQ